MPPPPRPPIICYDISSDGTVCRRRIEPISNIRSRKPITPTVSYRSYVPPTVIPASPRRRISPSSTASTTSTIIRKPRGPSPFKFTTSNSTRTSCPASSYATSNKRPTNHNIYDHNNDHYTAAPASHFTTSCRDTGNFRNAAATTSSNIGCSKMDNFNLIDNNNNNNRNAIFYNKHNNVNARQAYGQKLRAEAEQRERQRHHELVHKALDEKLKLINAMLNELKNHVSSTHDFGMAHNAALYIQKQDEENAKLRQKVDQIAENRAQEVTRQSQRVKQYHELLREKDRQNDERGWGLKDMSNLQHSQRSHRSEMKLSPVKSRNLNNSLSSSSSPTTITPSNSQGSSSTISLSTCPSPMSTSDEQLSQPTRRDPTPMMTSLQHKSMNNSHLVKSPHHVSFKTPPSRLKYPMYEQDPYPEDTLEVTDIEFFAKVEDQTMIEANQLMNRLQSTLKDFKDI